jgi:ATP-dependent RNA helicase DDX19/DBP5
MIGQSQSGTGKTAAFVLTMLSRTDYNKPAVQAICLAPTRELVRQIVDVVKEMGKFTPVKVALAVRDGIQKGEVVKDHIVVGTPGTVMELLKRRALSARDVNVFVLDEADNMLDLQGMGEQSMRVKKYPNTGGCELMVVLFLREHRCCCLVRRSRIKFVRLRNDFRPMQTKSRSRPRS